MIEDAPIEKERVKIVLGLGNPGRRYADTRHNVGHMVVDRLAFLKKEEFASGNGPFEYCRIEYDGNEIYLCKSTTYMNNTGKAAAAIKNYFDIAPESIMIISDDSNIPLGKIRFRVSGSDGGHNGLASVTRYLHTDAYPRLRLGVDSNPAGVPLEDYVLEDFDKDEFDVVDKMVAESMRFIENLALGKIENKSITITVL